MLNQTFTNTVNEKNIIDYINKDEYNAKQYPKILYVEGKLKKLN